MRSHSAAVVVFAAGWLSACGGGGNHPPAQYTVGGTTSGLSGTGLVLQINSGETLAVATNGSFTFATPISSGSAFTVTIAAQPANPAQVCTVTDGTGTIGNSNSTLVAVRCQSTYTIGGTVSGLVGSLVLEDNGSDDLTVTANGTFTFSHALTTDSAYSATIKTQPSRQQCVLDNGTGSISSANIQSITVVCQIATARFLYVTGASQIAALSIDSATGTLVPVPGSPFSSQSPGRVFADPASQFLLAPNSISSTVSVFAIDSTGAIAEVGHSPFATGSLHPCGGTVTPDGKFAYVIHCGPGSIAMYALDSSSGALTPLSGSPLQVSQSVNSITFTPDGKFAYAAGDNGGSSADLWAFAADDLAGTLTPLSGSPFSTVQGAGGVTLDPAGKSLYIVTSSPGMVDGFAIDAASGTPTAIPGAPFVVPPQGVPPFGSNPLQIAIHPSGKFAFVAAQNPGEVLTYTRDVLSGALTLVSPAGNPTSPAPYSLAMEPSGKFLYVVTSPNGNVAAFSIDPSNGTLTSVPGSPFSVGIVDPMQATVVR